MSIRPRRSLSDAERWALLSARQRQVAEALIRFYWLLEKEVAAAVEIELETFRAHRAAVFRKLDVDSRLVLFAEFRPFADEARAGSTGLGTPPNGCPILE